jgi:hypothetical protein
LDLLGTHVRELVDADPLRRGGRRAEAEQRHAAPALGLGWAEQHASRREPRVHQADRVRLVERLDDSRGDPHEALDVQPSPFGDGRVERPPSAPLDGDVERPSGVSPHGSTAGTAG